MNLFPRPRPFTNNGGGYLTLSFIPTLGTMILGLIAGGWLKSNLSSREKLNRFAIAGVAGLALRCRAARRGRVPDREAHLGRPTWVFFSGGWCFLLLAAFFGIIEMMKVKAWAFPLMVIGMNSIGLPT
jgi:predicted acyltransferase